MSTDIANTDIFGSIYLPDTQINRFKTIYKISQHKAGS